MSTIELTDTYTLVTCCYSECGITFAVTERWNHDRRKSHDWFYCPNGHRQCYTGKSEAEKLRDELEAQKRNTQWQRDMRLAAERDATTQRRKAAAARGQLTKIKNRVASGVCPVAGCKRSFTDVIAHLRTVHPDYHKHEDVQP